MYDGTVLDQKNQVLYQKNEDSYFVKCCKRKLQLVRAQTPDLLRVTHSGYPLCYHALCIGHMLKQAPYISNDNFLNLLGSFTDLQVSYGKNDHYFSIVTHS